MPIKTAKLLIVYASTHGQVEKIAKRIEDVASVEGVVTDVVSIEKADEQQLELYDFLIVAGSVHFGRHQRKLEEFIRRRLSTISVMEAALVSVSGSAATPDGKEQAEAYVHELARRTGWLPEIFITVGGAEPYTNYGFLTRIVVRAMARNHGRIVDVHRDYEFTDWDAVDQFARDFIRYASAKQKSA